MRNTCSALFLLFAFTPTVYAQTRIESSKQLNAATLAASCVSCHGAKGKTLSKSSIPSLNGLDADYIRTSLMRFKMEQRSGTVMNTLAKGYTDDQIEWISNYFGSRE